MPPQKEGWLPAPEVRGSRRRCSLATTARQALWSSSVPATTCLPAFCYQATSCFGLYPRIAIYEVVVSIGISEQDLAGFFSSVRLVTRFDHPWMVPEERRVPICIAEHPVRDPREAWRSDKKDTN